MNKIRIIDLFNKIANGEEVPKKIIYLNTIFTYYNETKQYYTDSCIETTLTKSLRASLLNFDRLTDEVEIIEEEKKLPEKLSTWFSLEKDCENDNIQYANHNFETMYEKINEICDYLKSK